MARCEPDWVSKSPLGGGGLGGGLLSGGSSFPQLPTALGDDGHTGIKIEEEFLTADDISEHTVMIVLDKENKYRKIYLRDLIDGMKKVNIMRSANK